MLRDRPLTVYYQKKHYQSPTHYWIKTATKIKTLSSKKNILYNSLLPTFIYKPPNNEEKCIKKIRGKSTKILVTFLEGLVRFLLKILKKYERMVLAHVWLSNIHFASHLNLRPFR